MRPDPLVLGFDTSAAHCAAALLSGDTVLASAEEDMTRGQAERLMPLLDEVLTRGGARWADLQAIGVGVGPGNFTGIRIAVSAARGLALGLNVPAVGVPVLDAMLLDGPYAVAAIAAPRDMFYSRASDGELVLTSLEEMPLPAPRAAAAVMGHRAAEIAERTGGPVIRPAYPLAEAIARTAMHRMDDETLARPAPLYVRPADAAPPREAPPVILP